MATFASTSCGPTGRAGRSLRQRRPAVREHPAGFDPKTLQLCSLAAIACCKIEIAEQSVRPPQGGGQGGREHQRRRFPATNCGSSEPREPQPWGGGSPLCLPLQAATRIFSAVIVAIIIANIYCGKLRLPMKPRPAMPAVRCPRRLSPPLKWRRVAASIRDRGNISVYLWRIFATKLRLQEEPCPQNPAAPAASSACRTLPREPHPSPAEAAARF